GALCQRARGGLAPDRRLHSRRDRRQGCHPTRTFGAQGLHPARLGNDGCPLARRQLGDHRSLAGAVVAGQPGAARDEPDHMDAVRDAFVRATEMSERAGFDMLELHYAHGYLLSAFITPLGNRRRDAYGGSLENRMRFPLEVFRAVRGVWPAAKPISVRISAHDWVGDRGITPEDAVEIARLLKTAGVDIIDVSAGQTSAGAHPVYGRMFQTPFSDRIRNEVGIATMAVGNIYEPDHVNSILMAGRADLCCLARPHLSDPYWTLHAAVQLGYRGETWPLPYLPGGDQLNRLTARADPVAERV